MGILIDMTCSVYRKKLNQINDPKKSVNSVRIMANAGKYNVLSDLVDVMGLRM